MRVIVGDGGVLGSVKEALQERIDRLRGWMSEKKNGQHLTFTFENGKGVEVNLNGRVKGTIPGNDLARALFLIRLGPNPAYAGLRSGLPGRG